MREIENSYICQECGRRIPTDRPARFISNCPSCLFINGTVHIKDGLDKSCPVCFSPLIFYNGNDINFLSISPENLFCSNLDCSGYTIRRGNSRYSYDIYHRGKLLFLFQPKLSAEYLYHGRALCTVRAKYMKSFIRLLGNHLIHKYKKELYPVYEVEYERTE